VSNDFFDILGLPGSAIAEDDLRAAYQSARKLWFFRQFDPCYVLEAKTMLAKVDEAYRALRNPACQAAILRQRKAPRRSEGARVVYETAPQGEPRPSLPPIVNRPKVVRELVAWAEQLIHQSRQPFTDANRQALAAEAYKRGIPFADAEELVERIVNKVESQLIGVKVQRRAESQPG
jgi:hypothetical protein